MKLQLKYRWIRDPQVAKGAIGWNGDHKVGQLISFRDACRPHHRWMWNVTASQALTFRSGFRCVGFTTTAVEAAAEVERIYDMLVQLQDIDSQLGAW